MDNHAKINAYNLNGDTALLIAIKESCDGVVQLLLENNARVTTTALNCCMLF